MERYDGKTKKDDYRKYALIALGVVALILLYIVVTRIIKKVSHPTPDLSIVVACGNVLDFQMQDEMELYLKPLVGDLDGDGREVAAVVPVHLRTNEAIAQSGVGTVGAESDTDRLQTYITGGEYKLYLLSDEERDGVFRAADAYCSERYCRALPEDLAAADNPYRTELTGCKLLEEQGWGNYPFYGCIQKDATDAEFDHMVALLRQIKAA